MIEIINGNLFDSKADIIAHQVNCLGVMGSGVAMQVKDKYPNVYEKYFEMCDEYKRDITQLLGQIQIVNTNRTDINQEIANLFAQNDFGSAKRKYTDIEAFGRCFYKLKEVVSVRDLSVAIPYKIGCDRGGADWDNEVYPILEKLFGSSDTKLEIWRLE